MAGIARKKLPEVCAYFLRLGAFGFGGPLAMIAQMQKELVEVRRWVPQEDFARAFALIKALPGPIAPQVAIFLALRYAGRFAGFLAGLCMILPAFLLILALAAFYGDLADQSSQPVLFGMQAAALGVIAESIWGLARGYARSLIFWVIVFFAGGIAFLHPSAEPALILGAGILGIFWQSRGRMPGAGLSAGIPLTFAAPLGAGVSGPALSQLGWLGLKSGAFVFGSGVAIVPLLMHDVVDVHQWLTYRQFMDALAFGQITPGPVVITITFIGYRVAGLAGAAIATIGIFAPCFFNSLTWFPAVERRLGKTQYAAAFAKWAIAAVIGTLVVAVTKLALAPVEMAGMGRLTSGILAVAAIAVVRSGMVPIWLVIPAGGLAGLVISLFI